jgi:hypothetical protein
VVGSVTQWDADEAIGTTLRGVAKDVQGIHFNIAPTFSILSTDVLAEDARQKAR